jgi:hypothetical protein
MTQRQAREQEVPAPRMYLVRLESEAAETPDTHDLFIEAEAREEPRRRAMVAQLRDRVRAGHYVPNLRLVAERILSER